MLPELSAGGRSQSRVCAVDAVSLVGTDLRESVVDDAFDDEGDFTR